MGCTQSTPGQACSCLPSSPVTRKAACATGPSLSLRQRVAAGGFSCIRNSHQSALEDGDGAAIQIIGKPREEGNSESVSEEGAHATTAPAAALGVAAQEVENSPAGARRSLRQSLSLKLNSRKLSFRSFLRSSGSGDSVPSSQDAASPPDTKVACDTLSSETAAQANCKNTSLSAADASAFFKAFNGVSRNALTTKNEEAIQFGNDGVASDDEPSTEEMRAVWCVMKASGADNAAQKIEWLHRLEWLLVKLNPMESNHPTRRALLEARVLELCLGCLRENHDDAGMCVSALAILVHMSLNDETSNKLASSNGLEDISLLLKKYYSRCQEHARGKCQGTASKATNETTSSDKSNADQVIPGDCGSMEDNSAARLTETSGPETPLEGSEQNGSERRAPEEDVEMAKSVAQQGDEAELLAVELVTLVWRLIFATSLDGDEYAQKWVKAGAAEPAIDSVASDLDVFCSDTYVCWVFGALRFLPLDNAELCEDFVQRRKLFEWTLKKMEMHHEEALVLENGFAVLANYQRNQPVHAEILSKLPRVWNKCLSWLKTDSMIRVPDVVYQGLYTVGLACSYCPSACISLREAEGMEFADKVVALYGASVNGEGQKETSPGNENAWSSNDKHVNVLQFAEGLRRLLLPAAISPTGLTAICQEPIQEADEEESDGDKEGVMAIPPETTIPCQHTQEESDLRSSAPEITAKTTPSLPSQVPEKHNESPGERDHTGDELTREPDSDGAQPTGSNDMTPLPVFRLSSRSVTPEMDTTLEEKRTPELPSPSASDINEVCSEGTSAVVSPDREQSLPQTDTCSIEPVVPKEAAPAVSVEQLQNAGEDRMLKEPDTASCAVEARPASCATAPSEAETEGGAGSPEPSCTSPDLAADRLEPEPHATEAI
ncbi:hypothetical protein BESB_046130 [Besnoitia besnoiti]|uniref:Uncharacterized protein n=1 Tax=Besnoitia besnoiti TaxID=94643 RepID=A0A2A9MJJ0_BESBE|nr:hypothetical protein BESB_046130 [Besnoitia besnoiti]PFH36421.1 hypothetical protein BESB_046130 [Besnoitia besnoiti]